MGAENRGYRILILGLATWGGVGFLPVMPGTWGALAALPLWYHLAQTGPWGYALGVAALIILGLGVAGPAQEILGRTDHPAIVVDEVAGLLITLAGVPPTWEHAVMGLVIFRTLDILKPLPIRRFGEGGNGGLEVMADDVAAGVIGRVVLEFVMIFWGGG
ncbi:MAG: phosphatidylglycerophosphatase A [Deltaproteobacteria bacterium CG07_land_8_20_14_0_80_60_11]|nr:MAG: phosphatidylglycerophosphatase A [Deltaproteobacteria bacterium CG07_land_8_20_14_0_80_60_11]